MGTHPIFESDFDCLTESMRTNSCSVYVIYIARRQTSNGSNSGNGGQSWKSRIKQWNTGRGNGKGKTSFSPTDRLNQISTNTIKEKMTQSANFVTSKNNEISTIVKEKIRSVNPNSPESRLSTEKTSKSASPSGKMLESENSEEINSTPMEIGSVSSGNVSKSDRFLERFNCRAFDRANRGTKN